MVPHRARLAVVLAFTGTVAAQAHAQEPTPAPAQPRVQAPAPGTARTAEPAPELARIKRALGTETPLHDAALEVQVPTFRTSVTQRVDIWKFWGEPDAVA